MAAAVLAAASRRLLRAGGAGHRARRQLRRARPRRPVERPGEDGAGRRCRRGDAGAGPALAGSGRPLATAGARPAGPARSGPGGEGRDPRDRLHQPRAQRVLGPADPDARLGGAAARLCGRCRRPLPGAVLHPRLRRQPARTGADRDFRLRRHARRQPAANDLGAAGRIRPDRHPRIRRFGQQRPMGPGPDRGADPRPGAPLPHGRAGRGPLPQRALLRRLGHAVAAGALSESVRRHLVHRAGPQRLPRLHRGGPVRRRRQRLSPRRRQRLPAGARQGPGGGQLRAVCAAGGSGRPGGRTAGLVRMGVFPARRGRPADAAVRPRHRRGRSAGGRLLARPLRHRAHDPVRLGAPAPRPRRQAARVRRHRRHLLPRRRGAPAQGGAGRRGREERFPLRARPHPLRPVRRRQRPQRAAFTSRTPACRPRHRPSPRRRW